MTDNAPVSIDDSGRTAPQPPQPRGQAPNIAATVVLLLVHGGLYAASLVLLGLLVMVTDPCGSVTCGDPAWADRAGWLGLWGGGAVLVADVVVAVFLLARRRMAFFVPIIGCVAQVALAIGAAAMEWQAGPV